MAMEKMTITMTSEDLDLFERGRCDMGENMSKSAYVRLLIAEHEQRVPSFIRYKEIISGISELNTLVKELALSENVDDVYKMQILERMADIKITLGNMVKK